MKFSISQNSHLGDSLFLLNLMYNHDSEFFVSGPDHVKEILDVFDYRNIVYEEPVETGTTIATIENLIQNWVPEFTWERKDLKCTGKIKLPPIKIRTQKMAYGCFQFDSRSFNDDFKKRFTRQECKTCIRKFSRSNELFGVGGKDTIPYLQDYKFKTGDLNYISQTIICSGQFIGVDSGMSHLAGTAQIDSDIIVQDNRQHQINRVMFFYRLMYPTVRCHERTVAEIPINL